MTLTKKQKKKLKFVNFFGHHSKVILRTKLKI